MKLHLSALVLIACHRCEKSATESHNSCHLITQQENICHNIALYVLYLTTQRVLHDKTSGQCGGYYRFYFKLPRSDGSTWHVLRWLPPPFKFNNNNNEMERILSLKHYNTGQKGNSSMQLILIILFLCVLILISLAFVCMSQFSQIWSHIPQPCLRSSPERCSVGLHRQIPV